jgi:hypothetical protein
VVDAGELAADDHNSPGLVELDDGSLVAAWSGHAEDPLVRTQTRSPDGVWTRHPDTEIVGLTSYNNLFALSDGSVVDLIRAPHTAPSGSPSSAQWAYVSTDQGATWTPRGPFLHTFVFAPFFPQRPYPRFAQRGDEIHFITTQGSPNEYSGTDIFYGYLRGDGVFRADGTQVGSVGSPATVFDLTPVYASPAGRSAWSNDLAFDAEGRPVAAFSVRDTTVPWDSPDAIRYFWSRLDGPSWTTFDIAPGGRAVFQGEPHYPGVLSLDPEDPNHVAFATTVAPDTGANLDQFDVYEGNTADGGATWSTKRLTTSAQQDLRPTFTNVGGGVQALL